MQLERHQLQQTEGHVGHDSHREMHDGECVRNNRRGTGEPDDTRRKRKYDNSDVVQSCVDLARYDPHLLPPSCAAVADRGAVSAAAIMASRILSVSTSAAPVGLIKLALADGHDEQP